MLLFYSNHCVSSKLLIDNIKRYDAIHHFKLINVEQYISAGHVIPNQIHSVPALMFKDSRNIIFGKQVFDFLLLPNKGFLLNQKKEKDKDTPSVSITEPSSFSLYSGIGCGDNFGFIDETQGDEQKGYQWAGIDDKICIPTPEDSTINMEKDEKNRKNMPDIASLRSQRELDLQQVLPAQAQAPPIIV